MALLFAGQGGAHRGAGARLAAAQPHVSRTVERDARRGRRLLARRSAPRAVGRRRRLAPRGRATGAGGAADRAGTLLARGRPGAPSAAGPQPGRIRGRLPGRRAHAPDTLRLVAPARCCASAAPAHAGRGRRKPQFCRWWSRCWRPSARWPSKSPTSVPSGPMCRASPAPGPQDEVAYGRLLVSPPAAHGPFPRRAAMCAQAAAPAVYLEVGAGSTLAALVRSTLRDAAPCVLPGLRGDDREWTEHLTTLGQLYVRGTPLRWPQVWGAPRRKVTCPAIRSSGNATGSPPPRRRRRPRADPRCRRRSAVPGRARWCTRCWVAGWIWPVARSFTKPTCGVWPTWPIIAWTAWPCFPPPATWSWPWRLVGRPAWQTAGRAGPEDSPAPDAGAGPEWACAGGAHARRFRAGLSHPARRAGQVAHARHLSPGGGAGRTTAGLRWVAPQGAPRSVAAHYARCRERGLDYGPAFQGLRQLHGRGRSGLGRGGACPRRWTPTATWSIPPCSTPACKSPPPPSPDQPAHAWLPVRIARYHVAETDQPLTRLQVHARLRSPEADGQLTVDIHATDDEGHTMVRIDAAAVAARRTQTHRAIDLPRAVDSQAARAGSRARGSRAILGRYRSALRGTSSGHHRTDGFRKTHGGAR